MRVRATKVQFADLEAGDIYSSSGQEYWDLFSRGKETAHSVEVKIRSASICPIEKQSDYYYRLDINVKMDDDERKVVEGNLERCMVALSKKNYRFTKFEEDILKSYFKQYEDKKYLTSRQINKLSEIASKVTSGEKKYKI